jgi:hypothetical protein
VFFYKKEIMMAKLNCRVCNGDGMVPAVYCNHETRVLRKSMRSCPTCEQHDTPLLTHEVLVYGKEVDELLGKGYVFLDAEFGRKAA